jgi:hypothetical protein
VLTFREKKVIIAPIQKSKAVKRRVEPSQIPQRVPAAEKGRKLDRLKMASEPRTDGSTSPIRMALTQAVTGFAR